MLPLVDHQEEETLGGVPWVMEILECHGILFKGMEFENGACDISVNGKQPSSNFV